jgi:hypothetical protein
MKCETQRETILKQLRILLTSLIHWDSLILYNVDID